MNRRQVLAAVTAGCTGGIAGCSSESTEPAPESTDGGAGGGGDATGDGEADDGDAPDETREPAEETETRVRNVLQVVTQVGELDDAGERVSTIRLGVQLTPGADALDLTEVTLQYVSDSDFANLVHEAAEGSANETFGTTAITAANPDDAVLSGSGDRHEVRIDLERASSLSPLEAGKEATVTFTSSRGAQTRTTLRMPDSLTRPGPGETVQI